MVELGAVCSQAGFDIAQALSPCELRNKVDSGRCSMICAKTSLPWFIGGPRDGRHHGLANAPIRVEIETRSKHELSSTNQTVIAPLVLNVGTALRAYHSLPWLLFGVCAWSLMDTLPKRR